MNESVIPWKDKRGRTRYQPVDKNGDHCHSGVTIFLWCQPERTVLRPTLYRSKARAQRLARRYNRVLDRRQEREFTPVDD